MKVFLSYCFDDARFVHEVATELLAWKDLDVFHFADVPSDRDFLSVIAPSLDACQVFVLFLGKRLGDTQKQETLAIASRTRQAEIVRVAIDLPGAVSMPEGWQFPRPHVTVAETRKTGAAARCAEAIVRAVHSAARPEPSGDIYSYEKAIFEAYEDGNGRMSPEKVMLGAPPVWPTVERHRVLWANPVPVDVIGVRRDDDSHIIVDARCRITGLENGVQQSRSRRMLTFPEAGPRADLSYPREGAARLGVGIVVSGGIAPGIGAVISGIVERHYLYHRYQTDNGKGYALNVCGFRDGFAGLAANQQVQLLNIAKGVSPTWPHDGVYRQLEQARSPATLGGTPITAGRYPILMKNGVPDLAVMDGFINTLVANHIDILYVIGGEGSMRAAHGLWHRARATGHDLSVVAVPKTMDNDILWVWQSFGFMSAVETAKQFVLQLHTEARSNPRLCVVQLFGSDSGFVVSHVAHASGVCDLALIPEEPFTLECVFDHIEGMLMHRLQIGPSGQSPYGLIIMSETAVPLDYKMYMAAPEYELVDRERAAVEKFVGDKRRIRGTTPDELRTGCLKIVAGGLQKLIRERMAAHDPYWNAFRVFTNEPRHLIRAIAPSVSDVIFGERLGVLAVDNAMAGYTDFMISQWLTEYVLVPLPLVVLGRKHLPTNGIFWKSVLASTGQPWQLNRSLDDRSLPVGLGHSEE